MSNNNELPEVDKSWRDHGPLSSHYAGEQKTDLWKVREQLWAAVEERVGKSHMYIDQIVRAIGEGVGEEHTLALKSVADTSRGSERLRAIVPQQIYAAILNYQQKGSRGKS